MFSNEWQQDFLNRYLRFAAGPRWATGQSHPKRGDIYVGLILSDEVVITREAMQILEWDELADIGYLMEQYQNLEMCEDPVTGVIRVRANVPCITTLERV